MANIKITEGQYNRLFDKPKEIIISESQYNKMFSLITEDRESKNMKKARNVVKSMFPDMDAMQVITAYPTKTITWDDGSVEKVGNMNESISYNPTGSRTKPEVDMTEIQIGTMITTLLQIMPIHVCSATNQCSITQLMVLQQLKKNSLY